MHVRACVQNLQQCERRGFRAWSLARVFNKDGMIPYIASHSQARECQMTLSARMSSPRGGSYDASHNHNNNNNKLNRTGAFIAAP